jgi:hypothetical protein
MRNSTQPRLSVMKGSPGSSSSARCTSRRASGRRSAYATRPDIEIAAHLGEVLWSLGRRDEAVAIWRDARSRDAANDVLRETLARLRVDL